MDNRSVAAENPSSPVLLGSLIKICLSLGEHISSSAKVCSVLAVGSGVVRKTGLSAVGFHCRQVHMEVG